MEFGLSQKQSRITLALEHRSEVVLNDCYQLLLSTGMLSSAFDALFEYDQKHETELLKTLYVYLQQERNSVQTAQLLYIHRNTLLNRLERIKQQCSINLDDYKERLYFVLSYDAWKETQGGGGTPSDEPLIS